VRSLHLRTRRHRHRRARRMRRLIVHENVMVVYGAAGRDRAAQVENAVKAL
jgi:hypothetical protein